MRFGQYYVDAQLKGKSSRLPVVDLPSGTVLFKAVQIIDTRSMFNDFLGRVSEEGFCQTPYQNVFTFPFPYVGFGLFHDNVSNPAWNKFNAFQVYTLNANHSFVNMIKPSPMMRGHPNDYNKDGDSIQRCDTYGPICKPKTLNDKGWKTLLGYDNCIHKNFARKTGIMGSISIADNDSILRKVFKNFDVGQSSMGQYLKSVHSKNPQLAAQLIMNTYMDVRHVRGIPEIVINARKPQSFELEEDELFLPITDVGDAIRHYIDDMEANIFNIFPVATITANGVFYASEPSTMKNINVSFEGSSEERKNRIEDSMVTFMKHATTEGLSEFGKLKFDFRTGFYVFEDLAPERIPGLSFNYKKLLLGDLSTFRGRKAIEEYVAAYKDPVPRDEILKKSPMGFPKAFIFSRPESLQYIYDYLQIPVPQFVKPYLKYDKEVVVKPRFAFAFRPAPVAAAAIKKGGSRTISRKKLITSNRKTKRIQMPVMKIVLPANPTPLSSDNLDAIKGFYTGISSSVVNAIRKAKHNNSR